MNSITEQEIYRLAQSMIQFGVSLDETINALRREYATQLEELAERARKGQS